MSFVQQVVDYCRANSSYILFLSSNKSVYEFIASSSEMIDYVMVAKDLQSAKKIVTKHGVPYLWILDRCLENNENMEQDSMIFLKWVRENYRYNAPKEENVVFISSNPIDVQNMKSFFADWRKERNSCSAKSIDKLPDFDSRKMIPEKLSFCMQVCKDHKGDAVNYITSPLSALHPFPGSSEWYISLDLNFGSDLKIPPTQLNDETYLASVLANILVNVPSTMNTVKFTEKCAIYDSHWVVNCRRV